MTQIAACKQDQAIKDHKLLSMDLEDSEEANYLTATAYIFASPFKFRSIYLNVKKF